MRNWKPREFPGGRPPVSVVLAAYGRPLEARTCLASLAAQTYPAFECLVVHDGPPPGDWVREAFAAVAGDDRFRLLATPRRDNAFGHPGRDLGRRAAAGAAVCFGNADNYYVPVYLEALADALEHSPADLAHCDCVHSHALWQPMRTELRRGRIDLACWAARRALVDRVAFDGVHFAADWDYLSRLLELKPRVAKVPMTLVVHN